MTDTIDVLRIIAKDARLDPQDRQALSAAADELDACYKLLVSTQAKLIESQGRRLATSEVLLALQKAKGAAGPMQVEPLGGYSSGWLKLMSLYKA